MTHFESILVGLAFFFVFFALGIVGMLTCIQRLDEEDHKDGGDDDGRVIDFRPPPF